MRHEGVDKENIINHPGYCTLTEQGLTAISQHKRKEQKKTKSLVMPVSPQTFLTSNKGNQAQKKFCILDSSICSTKRNFSSKKYIIYLNNFVVLNIYNECNLPENT